MKPYYEADGITLYHGDGVALGGEFGADVVLTDPPVEIGTDWFLNQPAVLLVNAGTVGDWLRHDGLESMVPWRRPAHTKDGYLFDVLLGFGLSLQDVLVGMPPTPPETSHPSERDLGDWAEVLSHLPGDTVLDPFVGSGTTLVAARMLGRKAIGFEIDERWCEVAARRLASTSRA